jgi:hypothetical protein
VLLLFKNSYNIKYIQPVTSTEAQEALRGSRLLVFFWRTQLLLSIDVAYVALHGWNSGWILNIGTTIDIYEYKWSVWIRRRFFNQAGHRPNTGLLHGIWLWIRLNVRALQGSNAANHLPCLVSSGLIDGLGLLSLRWYNSFWSPELRQRQPVTSWK